MTAKAEQLKLELAGLPEEDRAELAHFLIGSLNDEEADRDWEVELMRRAQEFESGRDPGKPAEQVFKEMREKYT